MIRIGDGGALMIRIGDRVEYIGSDRSLKTQYAGVLEVWQKGKNGDSDKWACLKPNRRATSWIESTDLRKCPISKSPSNDEYSRL